MERRWLIRTRSKQILGPASREKVIALLEKQSLNGEDELSSGNGYWFWVKEKELVEKYIFQGVEQDFNPITEADSVLGPFIEPSNEVPQDVAPVASSSGDQALPSDEDLEFPEDLALNVMADEDKTGDVDITMLDIPSTDEEEEEEEEEGHTSFIEMKTISKDDTSSEAQDIVPVEEMLAASKPQTSKEHVLETSTEDVDIELEKSSKKTKQKSDRYLFIILLILCVCLGCVYFYYRKVLNKPIPVIGLVSSVHAQSLSSSLVKKKL